MDELVGAFGSLEFGGFFSGRWFFVSIGGFGLFCFALEEGEEELVVTHLLAFGSVDAGEES